MVFKYPVYLFFLQLISICLLSCNNVGAITDTSQSINSRNWSYVNRIKTPFLIEDNTARYNLFINLRHTGDYRYSNIFLKIYILSPSGKSSVERREFKLSLADGQWLGKGTGNMYSYQLPLRENFKFTEKGNYIIELEQNMRNNPLKEVSDVGLRIEKSN